MSAEDEPRLEGFAFCVSNTSDVSSWYSLDRGLATYCAMTWKKTDIHFVPTVNNPTLYYSSLDTICYSVLFLKRKHGTDPTKTIAYSLLDVV